MPDLDDYESRIHAFERAWQSGRPPEIEQFLRAVDDAHARRRLLVELVCVDLEYRWRRIDSAKDTPPPDLTDYVERFSELHSLDTLPLELIEEEYRVRCRWAERPAQREFLDRFKERRSELQESLHRIDRELNCEMGSPGTSAAGRLPETARRGRPECDPRAPLLFNDYLLERMIGAGRMGKVYRAWQRSTGRHVAVKFLRKVLLQDSHAVERFIREAQVVSEFQHPGIVAVHGLGTTPGGGYFIAMDLVDGCDLSRVCDGQKVPLAEALHWIMQACDAIDHAHKRGIVHCDLKPANLLLNKPSIVQVTDFGLARSIAEESRSVDRVEGTAAYMAPEQISGWWGPISPRTDVYGLGAVLYALLTSTPPHTGSTLTDILGRVVSGVAVVPPMQRRSGLPATINRVCLRCLAKSPDERYADMGQLSDALRACRTIV